MDNGPVERRSDYRHIKATWAILTATAAIFAGIGGAVVWLGGVVDSPGKSIQALKAEVEAVKLQQEQGIADRHRLNRNVQFLIARECQAVDAQTRQTFASLGVSCRRVLEELQQNGTP